MTTSHRYGTQVCSLARALEVVGERWTLLIIRDSFYGVRRFTDFVTHLSIPRAILTERLTTLVEHGILDRVPGAGGHDEYVMTAKGEALWPGLLALGTWGDEYYTPGGSLRLFVHAACGTELDAVGLCPTCGGGVVPPADVITAPGPGLATVERHDPVSRVLANPRRLLAPVVTSRPWREE